MKSLFSFLTLLAFCTFLTSCADTEAKLLPVSTVKSDGQIEERWTWPRIIFGTRSHPCGKDSGCYCEGDRGVCLIIEPNNFAGDPGTAVLAANQGIAELELLGGTNVLIRFLADNSTVTSSQTTFTIGANVTITGAFGTPITLVAGVYTIDYSTNALGNVIVQKL